MDEQWRYNFREPCVWLRGDQLIQNPSFTINLQHSAVKPQQEDTNSCYERGSQRAPAIWHHKTGWHHGFQKTAATAGIWIPAAEWLHTCHFKEPSHHKNASHHLVVAPGAEEKSNKVGRQFDLKKASYFAHTVYVGKLEKTTQCHILEREDLSIYLSIHRGTQSLLYIFFNTAKWTVKTIKNNTMWQQFHFFL